jgi:hypothetical protein
MPRKEHDDGEISSPLIAIALYVAGWLAIAIGCFEALGSMALAGSTAAATGVNSRIKCKRGLVAQN